MRLTELTPEYCETIPATLEPGRLYISDTHNVAVHLCPCGCGCRVAVPFVELGTNPANYTGPGSDYWVLTKSPRGVTFSPSFGNWDFVCRSHYFITDNKIQWL